jgi:hypothetical protein
MTREQLEHVIRAAAAITKELSFVVIGSQAKCVAGREKDARFVRVMLKEGMIDSSTLEKRIRQLDPKRPIASIVAWAHLRAQEAQS